MTTYGAYDKGLPCLNPSCKSHGRPHPNCQCYGPMADGGQVENFCATNRAHNKGCEYFAEGGDVPEPTPMPTEDVPAIPESSAHETPMPSEPVAETEQLPSWDETKPIEAKKDELPSWDETSPLQDYQGVGSTLGSAAEGVGKGYLGFVAPMAENAISRLGVPSLSYEEQAKRAAANPEANLAGEVAGVAGSVLSGTGMANLATKGAEGIALASQLGSKGQMLLKGFLSSGILQGSDEVSKILLGQANPEDGAGAAAAHIGGAGILGLVGSAIPMVAQSAKLGTKLTSFLAGMGATGGEDTQRALGIMDKSDLDKRAFKMGQKAFSVLTAPALAGAYGAKQGYEHDGAWGAIKGFAEGALLGSVAQHQIKKLAPTIVKTLSMAPIDSNLGQVLTDALNHATNVNNGMGKINRAVDSIFKFGGQKVFNEMNSERSRNKIEKYLEDGGLSQELNQEQIQQNAPLAASIMGYAEGGSVSQATAEPAPTDGTAVVYPEQSMLMSVAKGRMVNYLNGLRPTPAVDRLAFDPNPSMTDKTKAYNRATDIAANPLSILEHARQGSLTPDRLAHFQTMYPELNSLVQKQLTSKITDMQLSGERPPSSVRQSLSLLLGVPMSSEFKPETVQTIQGILAQKAAQNAAQQQAQSAPSPSGKGGMSKLPQSMQTQTQSLVSRQQRQS